MSKNKNSININSPSEVLQIHRILFENAHDIILVLDEAGNIILANKKAILQYGYSLEELLNLNINIIRHPTMLKSYEEQMRCSEVSGIVFEGMHLRKDGTSFPVEVSSKTCVINNSKTRIHIIRDISDRKKSELKIMHLANFDALTDIPNRMNIMKQLELLIDNSIETTTSFALLLFDIDGFKNINDTLGHQAGDVVLQMVAKKVQSNIRSIDSIGRLGGDEFLIILPLIKSNNDVSLILERLFKEFQKPIFYQDKPIMIAISIGIANYHNGIDLSTFISQADQAMYRAKKKKGFTYEFYDELEG